MSESTEPKTIEAVLALATKHGSYGEPDHEVGDLQDMMRDMWSILTPQQRLEFLLKPSVASALEACEADGPPVANLNELDEEEIAAAVSSLGRQASDCTEVEILLAANTLMIEGVAGVDRPQYVHGHWSHIFPESGDVMTRLVFDREADLVVALQIQGATGWRNVGAAAMADVTDSLRNANPEALDDPEDYGLEEDDTLPDWAAELMRSQMATRIERPRGG